MKTPTIQQYITFYFGGLLFAEEQTTPVEDRSDPKAIPDGAFGYRFFQRQTVEFGGEELKGAPTDYSPYTYFGKEFTTEQVEEQFPGEQHKILISNLRGNNYQRACLTDRGNWRPMQDGDRVLVRPSKPGTKMERFVAMATERGWPLEKNEKGEFANADVQAAWDGYEPPTATPSAKGAKP